MFVTSIECLPFTKLSCSVKSTHIKLLSVNVKFPFHSWLTASLQRPLGNGKEISHSLKVI
jgi:hypothetical protein